MAKRRKGRTRYFDRRENDIRKAYKKTESTAPPSTTSTSASAIHVTNPQPPATVQQPDASLLDRHHPDASLALLGEQIPKHCDSSWIMIQSDQNIQMFTVHARASEPVIDRSLTISVDLSWYVFIRGRQLTCHDSPVLSDLPEHVTSVDVLESILEHIQSSPICLGNPDHDFIDLFAKEEGECLGTGGEIVAKLDTSSDVIINGQHYKQTIRASDCEMLSEGRCVRCRRYRAHLRVKRSRNHHDEDARVAHDSHTKYANLPRESLIARLKNTQMEKRILKAKCTYLTGKLRKVVKREGLKISQDDSDDMSRLMDELTPGL